MSKQEQSISVFNTLNNPDLASDPRKIIFSNSGTHYTFSRMEGDDIVVQPCTPDGQPDSILPPIKADKSLLRAERFSIQEDSE